MTFRIEDVKIDTYHVPDGSITGSGPTGMRMTHIPTGKIVVGIGFPLMSNTKKLKMMDKLKEMVEKNDIK